MRLSCDHCDQKFEVEDLQGQGCVECDKGHLNDVCPHCHQSLVEVDDMGLVGCQECADRLEAERKERRHQELEARGL